MALTKREHCRTISQRPIVRQSKARVHFIDDRLETLRAVSEVADLRHVQLYLAAWCAPPELCSSGMRPNLAEATPTARAAGQGPVGWRQHSLGQWDALEWFTEIWH